MYTNLISAENLTEHLQDPEWVCIDCRVDLARPEWGQEQYWAAHIPGALFVDLNHDLSSPVTPTSGRHPLPTPDHLIRLFSRLGIGLDTQVIVYDQAGGAFAARLWWMLRSMGHHAVAVLDGGFGWWLSQGYPTREGVETRQSTQFQGEFHPEMIVSAIEVERLRKDPHYRLIDARAANRFRGEGETIDTQSGHIPGAVNRFHGENLQADGRMQTAETLRAQFSALLGNLPSQNAVVYCGSGVTSCHHLLAMDMAGLPGARLYPGSWSEWIRDPAHPIATGNS